MRIPLIAPLFAAALLLGALAGGCGSGDTLSLEDYFQQMQEIRDRYDVRSSELLGSLPDDPFTDEEGRIALQNFFTESVLLFEGSLAEMADLSPPRTARDEHRRLLDTGDELRQAHREIESSIREAGTIDEVSETFALLFGPESDYIVTELNFREACMQLEEVGQSNDIPVDLHCVS